MIAHVISGFDNKVGDGCPVWLLADALDAMSGVKAVCRHTWDVDLAACLMGVARRQKAVGEKTLLVVYSYGCAALFHAFERLHALGQEPPTIEFLVIVAGVPRVPEWGQNYASCWTIPQNVRRAVAICTHPLVIPVCAKIRNESPVYRNEIVHWAGITHGSVLEAPVTKFLVVDAAETLIDEERMAA